MEEPVLYRMLVLRRSIVQINFNFTYSNLNYIDILYVTQISYK